MADDRRNDRERRRSDRHALRELKRGHRPRRLYRQIYFTVIACLILLVVLSSLIWRYGPLTALFSEPLSVASELVAAALPPVDAPPAEQQRSLAALAERTGAALSLFDADRRPIAVVGELLPAPNEGNSAGFVRGARQPAFAVPLPDGRWLVLRARAPPVNPLLAIITFLGTVALAVAIGARPVVKRLTRRLEQLQQGVETLGAGNFSARVDVRGRDEVAQLATSFNRAAEKIEALMAAHRLLLANASHELRTPLARIRLGIELLKDKVEPARRAELERDIGELDGLIDEILLSSRLDTLRTLDSVEPVDLLALLAEESARYPAATLDGGMASVRGDRRLLTRLFRNLLDNAERHGRPPIAVEVRRDGATAIVDVTDHGGGIPEAERERVFDPFHRVPGNTRSTGTGLGLSLVRQIAELHGGGVAVVAAGPGETRFRVTLPAA
ncbi:MAG: ATP-binding protein [Bauldia sp.]